MASGFPKRFDPVRKSLKLPKQESKALYPHMTIFENMAFGLRIAKKNNDFITETVGRTAKALGLEKMLERFHLGEKVAVQLDLDKVTLFDPSTENVIS
jgi:ABC-type thiamine transport system ATPase subunit